MMNVDEYLSRLNCSDCKNDVNLQNLRKLMIMHTKTHPFENLDLHMGKKITFSLADSYDRLMNQKRGGYCIQLNGCFMWLLKSLGYEVKMHPIHVYNNYLKCFYRHQVHALPVVKLDGVYYNVDVGTARPFNEPVEVVENKIQKYLMGTFKFEKDPSDSSANRLILYRSPNSISGEYVWSIQVKLSLHEGFEFDYFAEMNEIAQTKENPVNYYRTLLSINTADNQKAILVGKKFTELITTPEGDDRIDRIIEDRVELKSILDNIFKIQIDFDSFEPKDDYDLDIEYKRIKELSSTLNENN